jgi:hypothetical protein
MRCFLSPDNDDHDNHGDHNGDNDPNKVEHLALEGRQSFLGLVCQLGDASKDSAACRGNNDANAGPRSAVSALKTDILGLEVVLVRVVDCRTQWNGFACCIARPKSARDVSARVESSNRRPSYQ